MTSRRSGLYSSFPSHYYSRRSLSKFFLDRHASVIVRSPSAKRLSFQRSNENPPEL
jgi:hypothetical protein